MVKRIKKPTAAGVRRQNRKERFQRKAERLAALIAEQAKERAEIERDMVALKKGVWDLIESLDAKADKILRSIMENVQFNTMRGEALRSVHDEALTEQFDHKCELAAEARDLVNRLLQDDLNKCGAEIVRERAKAIGAVVANEFETGARETVEQEPNLPTHP
jgi:hypothetical protein